MKRLNLTKKCTVCGKEYVAHSNARKYCDSCKVAKYKEMQKRAWTKANYKNQQREYQKKSQDKSQCLICGAWVKAPAMHAYQKHGVSARDYKEAFELPFGKGLLPEYLKEIKREAVFSNGTVKNLKKGSFKRFKKGEDRTRDGVRRRLELKQISKLNLSTNSL